MSYLKTELAIAIWTMFDITGHKLLTFNGSLNCCLLTKDERQLERRNGYYQIIEQMSQSES